MRGVLAFILLLLASPVLAFHGIGPGPGITSGGGGGGTDPADPTDQYASALVQSVGVTATSLYSTGTVSTSGNIATFSAAFPTNVGVGDLVEWSGGYGVIKGISTDRTKAYLTLRDGATAPGNVSGAGFSVYRQFTSLANWEDQVGNASISATHELTDRDLTDAGDESGPLHVACYDDGNDSGAVVIATDWTVGSAAYIRIFTPYAAAEVGVSQRHNGTPGTGYHLASGRIEIQVPYARVEGLEVSWPNIPTCISGDPPHQGLVVPNAGSVASASRIDIVGNLIHDIDTCQYAGAIFVYGDSNVNIINNMVFDIYSTGVQIKTAQTNAVQLYNNTIFNCNVYKSPNRAGFNAQNYAAVLRNNLIVGNGYQSVLYQGATTGGNNIFSDTTSSLGLQSRTVTTNTSPGTGNWVIFTSTTTGSEDLRLQSSAENDAMGYGADLSADSGYAFSTDILMNTRGGTWDVGAHEVQ